MPEPVITWEIIFTDIDASDVVTVWVRELTDGVPSTDTNMSGDEIQRVYTASVNKGAPGIQAKLASQLKQKILSDRTKRTKISDFEGNLDVSALEAFINSQ
jgi:hypothetical protein